MKVLSGNYYHNINKANNNDNYYVGDVLSIKNTNHKIVYLWEDDKIIYNCQIRGGFLINRIATIRKNKVSRIVNSLTKEELMQLLIDLNNYLLTSTDNTYYIDKEYAKEKIESYLKKCS